MFKRSILKQTFIGIIATILLNTSAIFAQSAATINGTVVDQNSAVIQGASVRLINLGNNQELTVVTDDSGQYSFTSTRSGSYRLSVTATGFATGAESIIVSNEDLTMDFSLAPGVISDAVTITAGRGLLRAASEIPQSVTVVTSEQIEEQRPRSTFEAIERTPNLTVRETNPARERPRLRGLDSSRILILVDGERLNNARIDLQTGLSPSIIDVTQLESVEVVAGAGSSLYGSDSLAGTINLVSKSPILSKEGVNLGLRFDGNFASNGRVRRGNAVINLSNNMAALRVSGSMFRLENYKTGNRAITQAEVLNIGRFFTTIPAGLPNAAGIFPVNGASSYPIFSVSENGEILNGQGHGANGQFDLWFFPSKKHNFRGRYTESQHSSLGDAFSGPPYEGAQRSNPFRDYDKMSLRYEGLNLLTFLPRVSVNFYHQKLVVPQSDFTFTNFPASSAVATNGSYFSPLPINGVPQSPVFTGAPSRFVLNSLTENKLSVVTNNIDVQATVAPFTGLLVTGGVQDLKDSSQDEFSNYPFTASDINRPNFAAGQRGAGTPPTTYEDRAAFFQAELSRIKFLRLTGSLRVDNWRTKATPSNEFPLGAEFRILTAAQPFLQANPGALASQVSNLPLLLSLANRTDSVQTSQTTLTGSLGGVVRLPYGISPFVRYGTSYREPSISERYIIRNFNTGINGFYAIVVGNPGLEPETGKSLDIGVKLQGKNYTGSFGYFRNDLENSIIFRAPDTGNICAPATADLPGLPFPFLGCPIGRPLISFSGRINQADALITGFEGTGQYSFSLNGLGSISPFVSFGTLKGENKSPTSREIFRLENVQANPNRPFKFGGSANDFPLGNITPLRIITGVRYDDARGKLFLEYSYRHQDRVTRIDPTVLTGTTLVNYGTYANFNPIDKHDVRGGYTFRSNDRYRISLNAGIQNLTDKLFWEQFQNAPAPGRSYIFGFTTEFFNLLKK